MLDPESRDIKTDVRVMYAYQFQVPLGIMNAGIAPSMAELIRYLNERGIEPFSITRMGPLI